MKREKHREKHELPNLEGKDDGIDGKGEEVHDTSTPIGPCRSIELNACVMLLKHKGAR